MTDRDATNRIAEEKQRLRRAMLDKRMALTPADVQSRSKKIMERLETLLNPQGEPQILMAYVPIRNEVDSLPLLLELLKRNWTICFPVTDSTAKTITPVQVTELEHLEPGAFGIPEPPAGSPIVKTEHISWCLVPGVAFDRQGSRLGYGGGYYDRFLSGLGPVCEKVGLAFDIQIVDKFDFNAWDIPLSVLISESKVIRPTFDGGRRWY